VSAATPMDGFAAPRNSKYFSLNENTQDKSIREYKLIMREVSRKITNVENKEACN